MKRSFKSLTPPEILALAVSLEEEDGRIYQEMATHIRKTSPRFARIVEDLRKEEDTHRKKLIRMYHKQYGEYLPPVRREDVSGFLDRAPFRLKKDWKHEEIVENIALFELETRNFYEKAAQSTNLTQVRKLFSDLAEAERKHESNVHLKTDIPQDPESDERRTRRQLFVLQVIQPGLVGLVDGSVSTLAPLFAAAFATHNTWQTFLIGVAAAIGAAISMGFAEGLSDDGSLTGRGKPLIRAVVTGVMTFLGGILHTLPFLLKDFHFALILSFAVVGLELFAIAFIRKRYMSTPLLRSIVQVIIGGVLVFLTGVIVGNG